MLDPRFVRQVALPGFGESGQRRLTTARVVVAGAGGLGSALLPVLAAAGVGELVVVDDDAIETSNLHRQTLFAPADVGRSKAEVAVERLAALGGRAVGRSARIDATTAQNLIAGADVLIDATDDVDARYALDDAAAVAGVPLVWGSATGFTGQVGVAAPGSPRWRDLFPRRPRPDQLETCATSGVLPSLCTTVGGAMATETLKLLTGIGTPLLGRLLIFDAARGTVREVAYRAADDDAAHAGGPVENGEEAMAVEEISAEDTAALLQSDAPVTLVDVREPWEVEVAAIPGATAIPLGSLADRIGEIDADGKTVVVYCHGGVRSLRGAQLLQRAGLDVRSMAGGIDAWSRTVDPTVPRY